MNHLKNLLPLCSIGITLIGGLIWINVKISTIESDLKTTAKEVNIISTNHLTHLQTYYEQLTKDVANINGRLDIIVNKLLK